MTLDALWGPLIAGIVTLGLAWIQYQTKKLERAVCGVDNKLEVTKNKLEVTKKVVDKVDDKLEITKEVVDSTHTLVNSNMQVQLEISALALKRLAELTKDPVDREAADKAQLLYRTHLEKQKLVDDNVKIENTKK